MKTRFFVMFVIVLPVLAIFGCGRDEEDIIQLLKTDPPDGGELGNIGTLTMTFNGEPTEVTIELPGGSRTAKITGKTATYTFTTDDSLVLGSKIPIGISWVSKGGSTGGKIVKFTIVGGRATGVSMGKIAFVSERDGNYEIYVMNPDGSNPTNITNTPEEYEYSPSLSPDGKNIAFVSDNAIYIMNADGTNKRKLTNFEADYPAFSGIEEEEPAWSPDGKKIAFASYQGDYYIQSGILVVDADGKNPKLVYEESEEMVSVTSPTWSPDGKKIAFGYKQRITWETDPLLEIHVINADGSDERSLAEGIRPSWSPDGKNIAFVFIISKYECEIRIMNTDGSGETTLMPRKESGELISDDNPSWSPDGKAIVFNSHRRSGDDNNEIYKIAYDEANPLAATPVRLTFHGARDYDPSWGK